MLRIEEWIAADRNLRIGLGDGAELAADVAFTCIGADGLREHAHPSLQLGRYLVQHGLHDRRHAGHDDDVFDPHAGRTRNLIEDEIGTFGNARHPQACLVHLGTGGRKTLVQDGKRARVDVDRYAERLGDAVGRDVVMGRPDAASGENIRVARAQRIERVNDGSLLVANNAHFAEIDA